MLLTLGASLCVLLFAVVTWQVAAGGPLRGADERVGRAARGRLLPGPLAQFFADLGNMSVALPVLAVALGYAGWRLRRAGRSWWPAPLAAVVAMAAVPALIAPVKTLIDRPAPPGPLAGTEGFYPSGHTATAAVAYGAAAMLLLMSGRACPPRRSPASAPPRRRIPVPPGGAVPGAAVRTGLVCAAVVLLDGCVALGLVLRGYHWPLDVIGSWCLSGALLTGLYALCRRCLRPGGRDATSPCERDAISPGG